MIAIIPAAGFCTRFGDNLPNGFPKYLLPVGRKSIFRRIVEAIPLSVRVRVITNERYLSAFEKELQLLSDKRVRILSNGLNESDEHVGALTNIVQVIKDENIKDDVLVVVCDIVFDFSLHRLIAFFNVMRSVCVPVKWLPISEVKRAGYVEMNEYERIVRVDEHPENPVEGYSELGIYAINRERISYLFDCEREYHSDAPGYFLEYVHKKFPAYGLRVFGKWKHVTTIEDYEAVKEGL